MWTDPTVFDPNEHGSLCLSRAENLILILASTTVLTMSRKTLHLRVEAAPFETRAIITPESAKQLISDGYNVHIERSNIRFLLT
jgi:hypothetical protein